MAADLEIANWIAREVFGDTLETVEFIDAGFSADRKFHIRAGEAEYLLRLSEQDRRFEFESISKLRSAGIRCPEAIRFGTEGGSCYGLYSYIPGETASTALPAMDVADQYQFGVRAGEQLRDIHASIVPPGPVDEFDVRGQKYRQHTAWLSQTGFSFAGQREAAEYVAANLHLLHGRPTTFRHGDFHPGNLIVHGGKLAGVIDFNRCDYGDPFDDFYKTSYFGAPVSPAYARGLILGYFAGDPPHGFWPLYNLYVAAVLPADIVWAHRLFPHLVQDAIARVEAITRTHEFHHGGPPAWWQPEKALG